MKESKILVSIIMPVYNGEKYLKEALDSVLFQTYSNFELIIIDDGSFDRTVEILEQYLQKDTRIRVIKNPTNLGIVKSLNIGLKEARGNYIARIDSDDIWFYTKLEKQVDKLNKNPNISLLGTSKLLIDKYGIKIEGKKEPMYFSDADIRRNILKGNLFCHSSVIFRYDVVEKLGSYDERFKNSEDYEYWIRIINHFNVEIIREPLVYYRFSPEMISLRRRKEQIKYVLKAKIIGFKLIQFRFAYLWFFLKDIFLFLIPDWTFSLKSLIKKSLLS